jgi:hypothetical protein
MAQPAFTARVAAWISPPLTLWKPFRILPAISTNVLQSVGVLAKAAQANHALASGVFSITRSSRAIPAIT